MDKISQKIAVVFPGQGSQSVGMLSELSANYALVRDTFAEANEALGYDLWQLIKEGPAELLDTTTHTQPALLAASYAVWRLLQNQLSLKADFFAGHSLGEYTALLCAGVLSFKDALRVVAHRGEYMQSCVPVGRGGLAAIVGLDDATVAKLCLEAAEGEVLAPANYNSPGQVVVAGQVSAVTRLLSLAKSAGAKIAKLLPVSVPSHCELMRPAAERLETLLASIEVHTPNTPVIHNVAVTTFAQPAAIRGALVEQLYKPVRWVETIQYLERQGSHWLIECGPGKVLTGLNKRIVSGTTNTITVNDLASLKILLESFAGKESSVNVTHE